MDTLSFTSSFVRQKMRIDRICRQFESDWTGGKSPSVEQCLVEVPPHDVAPLLADLMAVEIELRLQAGDIPRVTEYLQRFPDVGSQVTRVFDEVVADYAAEWHRTPNKRMPERLGDFLILREMGRGAMGVVYEAEQQSLKRQVALKVLPKMFGVSVTRLQRFRREAQAIARLHHSHIVEVYGTGEQEGVHYFAMQFIEGHPADHVFDELTADRNRQFTVVERVRTAAEIGQQVAEALQYAHEQGVLHRDVKPMNILLDPHGNAWLTDFGLAKLLHEDDDSLSFDGGIVGTLRYVAPEGLAGESDERSDIYSLGLTLYELVTGRPAFPPTEGEISLERLAHREPEPLDRVMKRVPRDFATILQKAIIREPSARYQTAGELAEDLRRFLHDEPILARRVSPAERLVRCIRRHPWPTALVVGLVLAGAIVLWQAHEHSVAAALANQSVRDNLIEARRLGELAAAANGSVKLEARQREVAQRAAALAERPDIDPKLAKEARQLVAELDEFQADQRLLLELDERRLNGLARFHLDEREQAGLFRQVLGREGWEPAVLDPDQAAAMLRRRPLTLRMRWLGRLDAWANLSAHQALPESAWLEQILHGADDDDWRAAVRQARGERNHGELKRLAQEADVDQQPPLMLLALAGNLPPEESAELLKRAWQRHPNNFWITLDLALHCLRAKPPQFDEAARYLTAAISLRDNAPCRLLLGNSLASTGRKNEALYNFQRAIELQPDFAGAYVSQASELEHLGRIDEAEASFRKAISLQPDHLEARFNLSVFLAKQSRTSDAIATVRALLAISPTDAEALGLLAALLAESDRWEDAIAANRQAIAAKPSSNAFEQLGRALAHEARWPEAAEAYRQALQLSPQNENVQRLLAAVLQRQ